MLNSFLYPFYTSGEPQGLLLLCLPPPPPEKCNIAFSAFGFCVPWGEQKMGQIKYEYWFSLEVEFVNKWYSGVPHCHLTWCFVTPQCLKPHLKQYLHLPLNSDRVWDKLFLCHSGLMYLSTQ